MFSTLIQLKRRGKWKTHPSPTAYSAIMRHVVCFTLLSERRLSKAMNQAATRKKKQCASIVVSVLVLFCWFSFWYVVSRKEFSRTPWPQDPDSTSGCGAKLSALWFWAGEVKHALGRSQLHGSELAVPKWYSNMKGGALHPTNKWCTS